jgi:protease I
MAEQLQGKKVAILAADGVERVELEQPREALRDAGADVDVLSLHDGQIQARSHDLDPAGTFGVDGLVADASVNDFDALLLPGGHSQSGQAADGQGCSRIRPRLRPVG